MEYAEVINYNFSLDQGKRQEDIFSYNKRKKSTNDNYKLVYHIQALASE